MRWERCVLVLTVLLCLFTFKSVPAMASDCSTVGSPPQTLDELWSDCEDELGQSYENYRTLAMTKDTDFEIDLTESFKLTMDFSDDRDPIEPGIQGMVQRTYCVGRVKYKTLAFVPTVGGYGNVEEGYAYGYYATEKPVLMEPSECEDPFDESTGFSEILLRRPSVLYLPGFQNYATPAEAARIAAYLSSQTINNDDGKVFVLVIAPPSHLAINFTRCDTCGGEEFQTEPRWDFGAPDIGTGYGQLSFGAYGRDGGEEYFPTLFSVTGGRARSLDSEQGRYL